MRLKVRDTDALAEAAPLAGLEFVLGQRTHRAYAGNGACEHALRVPGDSKAYEAGLVSVPDGDGYDILCDTWGPGRKTAARLDKLRQEYAVAVTLKAARAKLARQGYTAAREDLPDGRVRVRLVRRGR